MASSTKRNALGAKRSPSLKICHSYPTMTKLGSYTFPKEDPKNISITWHTPWLLLTSANFHRKFFYIKKYRYRLHFSTIFLILLAFLESLKICLINLVIILMMSAKMATPGLLKITVFWNKGFDFIISIDDVTNRILSRDSNYIVGVFMWPKFGNCSISVRKVITTSIL